MQERLTHFRSLHLCAAVAVAAGALALGGCTTTPPGGPDASVSTAPGADTRVNNEAHATLDRLYSVVAGTRGMVARSAGVLVFPRVLGGSFIVGAEHGQGVLLVRGRPMGYYTTTGASIGFQAGASSQAVVYVFNSADALRKFEASDGWTVGADATVAIANVGANGAVSSQTLAQPVTAFVMNNAGIQAGVSLNGSKITRR